MNKVIDFWNKKIERTPVANQDLGKDGELPHPYSKEIIIRQYCKKINQNELTLDQFLSGNKSERS